MNDPRSNVNTFITVMNADPALKFDQKISVYMLTVYV